MEGQAWYEFWSSGDLWVPAVKADAQMVKTLDSLAKHELGTSWILSVWRQDGPTRVYSQAAWETVP